jgi:hypothetical protein
MWISYFILGKLLLCAEINLANILRRINLIDYLLEARLRESTKSDVINWLMYIVNNFELHSNGAANMFLNLEIEELISYNW